MKKYEHYKPTGISWLPEIPSHWELSQLRKYLSLVSIKGKGDKQLLSVTREKGVIERNVDDLEENHNFVPEDLSGYKYVQPGQFVINKMKSWQGSYGVSEYEGIVSPAYYVCNLNFQNKTFFSRAIRSRAYVDFFAQWSKGIRVGQWDLEPIALKSIPFFEPPHEEQLRIVSFLDKQVSLIDSCISQKGKELQTLYELKQAEIASVITSGLTPNVPMKDSGIPWMGEIPAHWETMRAKYMFKKEKREVRPEDKVITCFRDGQVTLRENRRTTGFTESITEIGYQGIRKGDLVIHQMDAFAGSIGVSDSDGKGTSVYHCCTPKGPYLPEYYALALREMARAGFIQSLYRGIRERSSDFNFQTFGKQFLPIPPEKEQREIVKYIHGRIDKIDKLIDALNKEIDGLVEYKKCLISDVVTGQVNVQE